MSRASARDEARPARRASWRGWLLPVALLVSIALNVFLASSLIGRFAHDQTRGDSSTIGFRRFAEALPDEAREKVRESFRARRAELRQERADLRQARERVMRTLAADPYDAGAAHSAFEALRQANADLSRVAQEAIVEAAANLPPELRRELAERRPRHRPRGQE